MVAHSAISAMDGISSDLSIGCTLAMVASVDGSADNETGLILLCRSFGIQPDNDAMLI